VAVADWGLRGFRCREFAHEESAGIDGNDSIDLSWT